LGRPTHGNALDISFRDPNRYIRSTLHSDHLLLRADYRRTIETYDRAAPGAILSLFYERLFGDASIRRLCDFCGLDSRPGPARQPAGGRGALRLTPADKPPAADNRSRI